MNFGTNTLVGVPASSPVVLPQPVAWLVSIAPVGPQAGLKSGPLNDVMLAPPLDAA
jgi:hypothetical protein